MQLTEFERKKEELEARLKVKKQQVELLKLQKEISEVEAEEQGLQETTDKVTRV